MENRSVDVTYEYNSYTLLGVLHDTGTEFTLDDDTVGEEWNAGTSSITFSFTHDNFLRCYIIDRISKNILHERYDLTLQEWINHLKRETINPIARYPIPHRQGPTIPSHTANYVPNEYRKLIKSMVTFVVDIHDAGYSTAGFGMPNIVIKNEVVKFWKVQFITASMGSKNNDFICLHRVVESLFSGEQHLHLPREMQHFLDLLISGTQSEDEYLISRHVAIMSHDERVSFFTDCWERQHSLPKNQQGCYKRATRGLGRNQNWTGRISDTSLGPLYDCYDYHTRTNGGFDDRSGNKERINRELIKCWRHLGTHLREKGKTYGYAFNDRDIDVMVMHVFADKIAQFQKLLWTNDGILTEFRSGE
eukprot:XP_025015038.1 uncharacterized protein LOC112536496 [Ricinus communis]